MIAKILTEIIKSVKFLPRTDEYIYIYIIYIYIYNVTGRKLNDG